MRGTSKVRAWLLLLAHAGLLQLISTAMRPTLSYEALALGSPAAALGILATATALPALALAIPVGRTLDRIGERGAFLCGAVLMVGACCVPLLLSGSLVALVLAAILVGLGHLVSTLGQQFAVSAAAGSRTVDAKFAQYTFATTIGQVLSPVLLLLPGPNPDVPPTGLIFAIGVGTGLTMLVTGSLIQLSPHAKTIKSDGLRRSSSSVLRVPGMVRVLIASGILLAARDLLYSFAPALPEPTTVVSGLLIAVAVSALLSRVALVHLIRWLGRNRVFQLGLIVAGISLACLALPALSAVVIGLGIVFGFSYGVCHPVSMAFVADFAPASSRGLAISMRIATNRLAQSIIPVAVGTISLAAGVGGVIVTAGALVLVCGFSASRRS